jgi:hypothetical protein
VRARRMLGHGFGLGETVGTRVASQAASAVVE